jgi:hypothetical protein
VTHPLILECHCCWCFELISLITRLESLFKLLSQVIASFQCEFLEFHALTPWSTFKQSKSLEENNNSILHMQISQKGFPKKRKKKRKRERERERKRGACCVSYHVTIE